MPHDPVRTVRVDRYPSRTGDEDRVAVEEPVEIRVDGDPLVVTMRTPGDDTDLAAGFCLTEGLIEHPDELERVEPCNEAEHGNVINVILAGPARDRWHDQRIRRRRDFYVSSSCGLCGTHTIDQLSKRVEVCTEEFVVPERTLAELPERMTDGQTAFSLTGGIHAAALFDPTGHRRLVREDVGRHNAVDKLIGALLLSGQLPARPGVVLVSGRASFELVQKAARARLSFLAAVGAPSSLAVEAAQRFGLTLVGFLRTGRFNVYSHGERIA